MWLRTGVYGHHKRVCTESWLWEKSPLPHRGIEPAFAVCQSDALTSWATSHPLLALAVNCVSPYPTTLCFSHACTQSNNTCKSYVASLKLFCFASSTHWKQAVVKWSAVRVPGCDSGCEWEFVKIILNCRVETVVKKLVFLVCSRWLANRGLSRKSRWRVNVDSS